MKYFARGSLFWGLPQPPSPCARRGRERQIFRWYACGGGEDASKCFCKSPRFSAERFAKTLPRLAASGGDNCVVPPQCSPPDPLFPAGGTRGGVTILYLYGCFIPRGLAAVVLLFANSRSYSSYSSYKSYLNPAPPRSAYRGRSTPTPHLLTTTQPCKR